MEYQENTWQSHYQSSMQEKRLFEIREDKGYKAGDTLLMREWDQAQGKHTGRACRRFVWFVEDQGYTGARGKRYVILHLGAAEFVS